MYVCAYVITVLLYPAIYLSLEHGFYAPYVRFEKSSEDDVYRAGQLAQAAWRRMLEARRSPIVVRGIEVKPDDVSVQRVRILDDGTIRFSAIANLRSKGGIHQALLMVSMPTVHDAIVEHEPASGFANELHFTFPVARVPESASYGDPALSDAAFDELFKSPDQAWVTFPRIEFKRADFDNFRSLVEGYIGDPQLASGSYFRMLYYSVTVMTTLGFGDIVPISPFARFFTALQAIAGVTILGLFLNAIAYRAGEAREVAP